MTVFRSGWRHSVVEPLEFRRDKSERRQSGSRSSICENKNTTIAAPKLSTMRTNDVFALISGLGFVVAKWIGTSSDFAYNGRIAGAAATQLRQDSRSPVLHCDCVALIPDQTTREEQ